MNMNSLLINRKLKILAVVCFTAVVILHLLLHIGLDTNIGNQENPIHESLLKATEKHEPHHILIIMVNIYQNPKIARDFRICITSICKRSCMSLTLHIVTDERSQGAARRAVEDVLENDCRDKVVVEYHDSAFVVQELADIMVVFRELFTSSTRPEHIRPLFFLSVICHRLFPDISKIIMLDTDLKFKSDIRELWEMFNDFSPSNLIGISQELQPLYRHITLEYRKHHPGTKVGASPPDGYTGFNSGVVLMDLARLRNSILEDYLLDLNRVEKLAEKYMFKGFLGDQDYYTLLSFDHPELFHVLPCTWNRQLGTVWNKTYPDIFDEYHNCKGEVNVYHGNGNTPFPEGV